MSPTNTDPHPRTLDPGARDPHREHNVETSQLATPRPLPRENRGASILTPIASFVFLAIVAIGIAWILFYPRVLTVHGTVESFGTSSMEISTLEGDLERFVIEPDTEHPQTLEKGDSVEVRYRQREDAKIATEITIPGGSSETTARPESADR